MADYKVIHKAQGAEIPWEPGCPVVVTALQVSRNTETSECWLQAKARNVSGADAASIYAAASLTYADGSSEELPVEFLDADVAAGSEQNLRPRKLPRGDVQTCSLAVTRVEASGETWGSAGEALPLPKREKLALSARAAAQRAINLGIGPDAPAVLGKVQDRSDWWACACGQVNVRRDSCCECHLPKAALVANEDEAALLADADERDDETYAEAVRLQEQGTVESLAKAIEKFESLGDRDGCADRATDCGERLSTLKTTSRKRRTKIGIAVSAGVAVVIATAIVIPQIIEQARIEAEYQYVTEHLTNSDEKTYEHLCELKDLGYKDAANVYESLYEWHFELVATTEEAYAANGFVDLAEYSGSSPLSETGIAVLKYWGGHPGEEKRALVAFECEYGYDRHYYSSWVSLKGGLEANDEDSYCAVKLCEVDNQISKYYSRYLYESHPDISWRTFTSVTAKAYVDSDSIGNFSLGEYGEAGNAYAAVLNSDGEITPVATSGTIVAANNQ